MSENGEDPIVSHLLAGDVVEIPIRNVVCTAVVLVDNENDPKYVVLGIKNPDSWYGEPQLFRRVPSDAVRRLYRERGGKRLTAPQFYNPHSHALYEKHVGCLRDSLERVMPQLEESADSDVAAIIEGRLPAEGTAAERLTAVLSGLGPPEVEFLLAYIEAQVAEDTASRSGIRRAVSSEATSIPTANVDPELASSDGQWLRDVDAVLERLTPFEHLARIFDKRWVEGNHNKYSIFWWHPVFMPTSPELLDYLRRFDEVLGYLEAPGAEPAGEVPGLTQVKRQLKQAANLGNFTSHRDELFFGAALHRVFPSLAFGGEEAGADLNLTLQTGESVDIELTATEKVKDLEQLQVSLVMAHRDADGDFQYEVRLIYEDDRVTLGAAAIDELVTRVYVEVRSFVEGETYTGPVDVASKPDYPVTIKISRVGTGRGGVVFHGDLGGGEGAGFVSMRDLLRQGPDAFLEAVEQEIHQLRGNHNIVAVNLTRHTWAGHLLREPQLYDALGWLASEGKIDYGLNPAYLAERLDAAIGFWLDGFGNAHPGAFIVKRPETEWLVTEDAKAIIEILTSQPGVQS